MKQLLILTMLVFSLQGYSQFRGTSNQYQQMFSADSINKDELASGVTPIGTIKTEGEVRVTFYTFVDSLSTNAGYMNFWSRYYSTGNNKDYSLLKEFLILTNEASWDTTIQFEINTSGFKHTVEPVDTTQAIKTRSDLNWDYKD